MSLSKLASVAAVFVVLLIVLVASGNAFVFAFPLDILAALTIGWIYYLVRVIQKVVVNWGGVLTATVCVLLFSYGLHCFLSWFTTQKRDASGAKWRPRWTMGIVGVVVLMFVAGTTAVGLAHQTVWLFTSKERLTGGGIRDAASRAKTANDLKQIGVGLHNHHEIFNSLPPGATFDALGRMLHGWQTLILPYVEREGVGKRIRMDLPWNHSDNLVHFRTNILEYTSGYDRLPMADADGLGLSHFSGNAWVLGGDEKWRFSEINDGAANTLLAGEAAGDFMPWGRPGNWRDPALGLNQSPAGFGSPSEAGMVTFLFVDGSARAISDKVNPTVLRKFATPKGAEPILDADWIYP